jgi:hypothetical protein
MFKKIKFFSFLNFSLILNMIDALKKRNFVNNKHNSYNDHDHRFKSF